MNRRIRLRVLGAAGVLLLYALTLPFNLAYADGGGAVGSSGTGGSTSSGGYYTSYDPGWGWRNYGVEDSGPPGGFLNGSWSAAQAACRGYSTNILVFVLSSSSGVQAGRDYKSVYYGPPTFNKYNYTGAYVTVPAAQAAYNALPASIRGSSVFGANVGWFCYGILPTNPAPIGVFDSLDCTYAQGWAFDPSKSSQSIRVDVQVDGDTKIWRATDVDRTDVNNAYGITGNHGFKDDISAWVSDGGTHTVEPFAIDVDSSGNTTGIIVSLGKRTVSNCRAYTLTPTVAVGSSTAIIGQTVGLTYSVSNAQTMGVQSNSTNWGLREVTIPAGTAVPAAFLSYKDGSTGCSYFMSFGGGITCNEISTSATTGVTNAQVFPGSPGGTPTTMSTAMLSSPTQANIDAFNTITIPASATPGTRICRVLSVLPRDQGPLMLGAAFNNRDSAVTCILVASTPYAALVGGSSWAGGGVTTPFNSTAGFRGVAGATFGSFGEYGLFATGVVNGFGSGGEYWNPGANSGMNPGTRLTFANETAFGSYTPTHVITNQSTLYAGSTNTPGVVDGNGHVVKSGVDVASGSITLNASGAGWAIPAGVHAVIYAPGYTVTIAGDITYSTAGVSAFGQLASLVIIAKNITINGSVQQVAGSFYAVNQFVSCTEGPVSAGASAAIATTGACNKQLTVNGSISVANQAANSLVFNRSYGGEAAGQPSEIIRMRPEVFITPYETNKNPSSLLLTTVQETELPARY